MEGGGTRTRRRAATASPGRNKVWVEPPGKTHHLRSPPPPPSPSSSKRVAVVYYLCRNRHLEHPHFIEVPLASPDGLYLRGLYPSLFLVQASVFFFFPFSIPTNDAGGVDADVINRLNVLRGKGMAAMYSWSCKRYIYLNSFGGLNISPFPLGLVWSV